MSQADGPCTGPDASGIVTCTYATPGSYTLTIPGEATSFAVVADGAQGGGNGISAGGKGAEASATFGGTGFDVDIVVGAQGGAGGADPSTGSSGLGGAPDGGNGGATDGGHGGGGGGSSAVQLGGFDLVRAGGGGGASLEQPGGNAGADGMPAITSDRDPVGEGGQAGNDNNGGGGPGAVPFNSDCGTGELAVPQDGDPGHAGQSRTGGAGGDNVLVGANDPAGGGGGGGGGERGGGGGGGVGYCSDLQGTITRTGAGSGGGGSSFVSNTMETSSISDGRSAPGEGDGKVVISYTLPVRTLGMQLDGTSFTEGVPFFGEVATFSDTIAGDQASDFSATIDWGDGTTSDGTVSGSFGSFSVAGSHTYTRDTGNGPMTVSVTGPDSSSSSATGSSAPDVADQGPLVSVPASPVRLIATGTTTPVSYSGLVSASDYDDPPVTVRCTPASGSHLALGTTHVTCAATNADGTASPSAGFDVQVGLRFLGFTVPKSGSTVKGGTAVPVKFRLGLRSGARISDSMGSALHPVVHLLRGSGVQDVQKACAYSASLHGYSCSVTSPRVTKVRAEYVAATLATAHGDVPLSGETPLKMYVKP